MKICNYCGTGMDNSVMKCPFCRMEMDTRGAVKYQDDEPFDPNKPAGKARDGKTPAELRYEASLNSADDDRGLSYKSFFKDDSADLTVDAKTLLDRERQKEKLETQWADFSKWHMPKEESKTPKQEFKLPEITNSQGTFIGILKKTLVFVIVFTIMTVVGIIGEGEYEDYSDYDEYYPSAEEFVPGTVDEAVYLNKYAGIKFDTDGICDYVNIYEDDKNLWFSEFYAQEGSDHMYVTYVNEDYSGYMSAEEMVEEVEEYTDGTVVSHDMNYICGHDFVGITTYTEYEDEDDGQMYGTYDSYMACQVTDEYYAIIEIVVADYNDIAEWIDGFEDV